MTYLRKIAEQIMRLHEGGNPSDDSELDPRELYLLITQSINDRIKKSYFSEALPMGTQVPANAAMGVYNAAVSALTGSSNQTSCTDLGQFGQDPAGFLDSDPDTWTAEDWAAWTSGNLTADLTFVKSGRNINLSFEGVSFPFGVTENNISEFFAAGGKKCYIKFRNGYWSTAPNRAAWIDALSSAWVDAAGNYWTFSGVLDTAPPEENNSMPVVFAAHGITNLTIWDTGFSFDYNLNAIHTSECDEVINQCLTTLDRLVAIPDGTTLYEDVYFINIDRCCVDCNDATGYSKATLPVQPMNLPRGMGIWRITNPDDPFVSFIPVQPGEMALVNWITHTGMNEIIKGLIAYEWAGKTITFNRLSTTMPSTVDLHLIVVDPDSLAETDLLPIPPEIEQDVIQDVLAILKGRGKPDEATDQNETR